MGSAAAYRWSSHRTYLGHRRSPDFMIVDQVMEIFGGSPEAFGRFVDGVPSDGVPSDGLRRARQRALSDPRIAQVVERTLQLLGGHTVPGTV